MSQYTPACTMSAYLPNAHTASAAYTSCLNKAFAQCPLIIKRWCTALESNLYERSSSCVSSHEQRVLQDSAAALKAHQDLMAQSFARQLSQAIAEDTQTGTAKKADATSRSFSSLRFDQLELMGDDQVQQTLDSARLQQFLALASDAGLADFSARLSTAQGFNTVQVDKNPLRPEVFSQALLKLVRSLQVDNDLRSLWLTHGAQLLGKELQALYVLLDTMLEQQRIAPARYGVAAAPDDASKKSMQRNNEHQQSYADQQSYSNQQSYTELFEEPVPVGLPAALGSSNQPDYPEFAGVAGFAADPSQASHTVQEATHYPTLPTLPTLPEPPNYDHRLDIAFNSNRPAPTKSLKNFKDLNGLVGLDSGQPLTLEHLQRLMAGDYDSSFDDSHANGLPHTARGTPLDFSHTLPAAMDALAELEQNGLAQPSGQQSRPTPALPVALLREQLRAGAKSLGQALGIEVVGLMVEKFSTDQRLLEPVRHLIAAMEPALLRVGMTDPRFFSDKKHPARLLLDTISANALAYPSKDAPGFASFMQDLQAVTAALTHDAPNHDHDHDHNDEFTALLVDFEQKQAGRTLGATAVENATTNTPLPAEQRSLLVEKIAQEMRWRADFVNDNTVIASFLTGPWAHVMANERLLGEQNGTDAAQAVYSLTLDDLLWSLDATQVSRQRLLKVIPGMLKCLRAGLLSINYPPDRFQPFYNELMARHQTAIKTSAPDLVQMQAMQEPLACSKAHEYSTSKAQSVPSEVQPSSFLQDWDNSYIPTDTDTDINVNADFEYGLDIDLDTPAPALNSQTVTEPAAPPQPSQPTSNASPANAAALLLGTWVDLLSDARWLRAQLTWINPHNTLFMFTSEGRRSHSMTARMLQQLLTAGKIRIVG